MTNGETIIVAEKMKKFPFMHKIDMYGSLFLLWMFWEVPYMINVITSDHVNVFVPFEMLMHGPITINTSATGFTDRLVCNPHFQTFLGSPAYLTDDFMGSVLTKAKSKEFLEVPKVKNTLQDLYNTTNNTRVYIGIRLQQACEVNPTNFEVEGCISYEKALGLLVYRFAEQSGRVAYNYICLIHIVQHTKMLFLEIVFISLIVTINFFKTLITGGVMGQICTIFKLAFFSQIFDECLQQSCGDKLFLCWWQPLNRISVIIYCHVISFVPGFLVMCLIMFDPPPDGFRWVAKPGFVGASYCASSVLAFVYGVLTGAEIRKYFDQPEFFNTFSDPTDGYKYNYGNGFVFSLIGASINFVFGCFYCYVALFSPSYPRHKSRILQRRGYFQQQITKLKEDAGIST